jgi:hypothetical protein
MADRRDTIQSDDPVAMAFDPPGRAEWQIISPLSFCCGHIDNLLSAAAYVLTDIEVVANQV